VEDQPLGCQRAWGWGPTVGGLSAELSLELEGVVMAWKIHGLHAWATGRSESPNSTLVSKARPIR